MQCIICQSSFNSKKNPAESDWPFDTLIQNKGQPDTTTTFACSKSR